MHGRQDVPEFIKAFAGDDRSILDYVVEEVLQRRPKRVWSFLLQDLHAVLVGPVVDQAALHGVIIRIRDLGLPLLSVRRVVEA